MIFLYHQEQLEQLLADSVRIAFLKAYGYGKECLEEKLKILSLHMKKYYNKTGEFPHEIGVFLGYPQGGLPAVKWNVPSGNRISCISGI